MSAPFGFQIHHIFPREIFESGTIGKQLTSLFEGSDSAPFRDTNGNKIALYADALTAENAQALIAASHGDFLLNAGFGGSHHLGSHVGYNLFAIDQLSQILTNPDGAGA